ncbi:PREDICTED: cytoplasmic phosphatidylinositol transfer protein 1-like isoform X1 [Priapulus caudatus]|uniref:Cytoplasmic phosphatidylinositol transfer protein 1-like isoform X1 n=1 Tax=Priapulus caudatus TaxID=37621 RepID=A0ABM1EPH6_PRICU|nr:PREDICTED: cytoplasmic phosphatidylinositol transfer protein 1-like isoform X1 [Priapulus caudatus]
MPLKEYRICMPLTVEEYRIGQLYMISKHSHEQTAQGEGVEVLINDPIDDPQLGHGQYTEKRIHLSSRLPSWIRGLIPRIFYVTEKAWNFYPYTKTEYTCSFLPRFSISIETRYEDNNGSSENCLELSQEVLAEREVDHIDIALDPLPDHKYKESEDCTKFKSVKTNRGPLEDNWRETSNPIMCSYKAVEVKFEVWGLQTRVEGFVHRAVRDVLLLGHKQAFTWIDEWYGMTIDDIRQYEKDIQAQTNKKVLCPGEKQTVDAAEEAQTTEVIQAAD